MWKLGLLGLMCVACTRPNLAYGDPTSTSGSTTTDGSGTGGPGTTKPDPSTTASTASTAAATETADTANTDTASPDLPVEPTCPQQPSPGLSIQLGDPARFGGVCPVGITISTRLSAAAGGEVLLDTCNAGCSLCSPDEHPLSAFPLSIDDHLPTDGCLVLEAREMLLQTETRCHWGALTIHSVALDTPYVIATAHSFPPTPLGIVLLADALPDPLVGPVCACETVQGDDCCPAGDPPELWYYPLPGQDVFAPGDAPLAIPSGAALDYSFRLFQAERIPTCEAQDLELSWAVVATL